ncbi:hypothetical protein [Renibacterium salmoninarum]|nr:hypothetical protein [Renibacterium salmoninarum]
MYGTVIWHGNAAPVFQGCGAFAASAFFNDLGESGNDFCFGLLA